MNILKFTLLSMKLSFLKYINVYKSNHILFSTLNFYENTIINYLNNLSHIAYYSH